MKLALITGGLWRGGSEKLILEYIKHSRNHVDLYTYHYEPQKTFKEFRQIKPISLVDERNINRLRTYPKILREWILALLSKIDIGQYDAILISKVHSDILFSLRNYIPKKTFTYYQITPKYSGPCKDTYTEKWHTGIKSVLTSLSRTAREVSDLIGLTHVDWVIFNSNFQRRKVIESGLVDKNKDAGVVHPGVDFPIIKKHCENDFGRYIVYISRFAAPKRQLELLKAWSKSKLRKNNFKLVLAGGAQRKEYYNKLENLTKSDKSVIIIPDPTYDEIHRLYRCSTGGIFLGYEEDFGIVPLEVLSYGKTLITVDRGGFMEIVNRAPSVLKIKESCNKNEFIKNIRDVLDVFYQNVDYYYEEGKTNRKFIRVLNLGWDRFAEKIDNILDTHTQLQEQS